MLRGSRSGVIGGVGVLCSFVTLLLLRGPLLPEPLRYSTPGLPVAKTQQGLARGVVWTSRNGSTFNVFRGIPYAKQPVGGRRFKKPEALDEEDTWEGIKDFTSIDYNLCHQVEYFGNLLGSEDCLNLNVYSHDINPEKPLAVMVWIHGGGFSHLYGGSLLYGPQFIMDHNVVLVSFQYRLGILGFLSLENEEIPGNQGLWDMRMALIWVQQNIRNFGGDPERVTIFGESAGAMAVNFLMVSPQMKGLFHQAIMQSGTAISPFTAVPSPPSHYTKGLAAAVGCSESDIVGCLQTVTPRALYDHMLMFDECSIRLDWRLTFPGPYVPMVDSYLQDAFLPQDPEEALKSGNVSRVPLIIGFNQEDGLLFTTRFLKEESFLEHFNANWNTCAPINLLGKESHQITEEDLDYLNFLANAYSKSGHMEPSERTRLFTDAIFAVSTQRVAKYLAQQNSTVYKYYFTYRGSSSISDFSSVPAWKIAYYFISRMCGFYPTNDIGASHADDLMYIFKMTPIMNMIPSDIDVKMSKHILGLWTNFVKYGNPNGKASESQWISAKPDDEHDNDYFVIDKHAKMKNLVELERLKLWK